MPAQRRFRGFTLIELMITIAIIAVLSAVGLVAYNKAQMLGRDSRRKSDLRAMAVALELYRQKNGRFPCGGWWQTSSAGWTAITDAASTGACDGSKPAFDTTYISKLPIDPLETGAGNPWDATNPNISYHYGLHAACNNTGQYYVLIAQLENKNDTERLGQNPKLWCDGTNLTAHGFNSSTSFVITSDN